MSPFLKKLSKDLFIKNRSKHSSNTLLSLLRFFMNKSLSSYVLKRTVRIVEGTEYLQTNLAQLLCDVENQIDSVTVNYFTFQM